MIRKHQAIHSNRYFTTAFLIQGLLAMKKEPFLLGAMAGVVIFYILKKISPKKRTNKVSKTTKSHIQQPPGGKI